MAKRQQGLRSQETELGRLGTHVVAVTVATVVVYGVSWPQYADAWAE